MPPDFPAPGSTELAAALLQAAITTGLAAVCGYLYYRYRKPYFAWFAAAWFLYVLRIGAISLFLTTADRVWLYWHQVATGWTALGLLWAALVFSQQLRWRWTYLAVVLFPPLWSFVAIYQLRNFFWAAGPAVLFLSLATLWTGWAFRRYHRRVGGGGAALLAAAFLLWGLHHLDYPFLRARGAWNPWGYYLDIIFALAVGTGILLLVLDDLRRGLSALSALSGDLQRAGRDGDVFERLLARPLTLASVRGSAIYLPDDGPGRFGAGAGACVGWAGLEPEGDLAEAIERARRSAGPQVLQRGGPGGPADRPDGRTHRYTAVLPVLRDDRMVAALVLAGDARDPFTALDDRFLVALGQQVGAALENEDLYRRLQLRTEELARLSTRMVRQHEEERRRLSRELHDETAQVFSAVKMQLEMLAPGSTPELNQRLAHVVTLIDTGIRSIRSVTNDLRPSLLDDLGLAPALRSLGSEFAERSGVAVHLMLPATLPRLSAEAELALFRAVQEALSNVARHADARRVEITLAAAGDHVSLVIADDGRGLAQGQAAPTTPDGHMGLAGMRERLAMLGGALQLDCPAGSGLRLAIRLPLPTDPQP